MQLSKEQMAINRLMCGNTAHSCKADYIQLAIKALEKQVPKQPNYMQVERESMDMETGEIYSYITYEAYCPYCGNVVGVEDDSFFDFCPDCGQKLDWGDLIE